MLIEIKRIYTPFTLYSPSTLPQNADQTVNKDVQSNTFDITEHKGDVLNQQA